MLARSPRAPGKTRLTADLPLPVAEALRQALLLDAVESALAPGWPLHLFIEPAADTSYVRSLLEADPALTGRIDADRIHAQTPGDLGARMCHAMARTSSAGADIVVLVGSDTPDLPPAIWREAVSGLGEDAKDAAGATRLVFGPALDGGFYLVAARDARIEAFDGVSWSQPSVLADVRARAEARGREVLLVSAWHDVDTPDDLRALLARAHGACRTRAVACRRGSPYNPE